MDCLSDKTFKKEQTIMFDFFIYSFLAFLAALCFICSYQFAHQKWGSLIAGYNDLTDKQKLTVDFKAISKSTSRCAFAGGSYILFVAGFLYFISNNELNRSTVIILFTVPSLLFLVYILRSVVKSAKYYTPKI